jgi:hypothetical protein
MERRPVGGILDGTNGNTKLLRRRQSQKRRSGRLRFLGSLRADQRFWLGRCGLPWRRLARHIRRRGVRREGRSRHHSRRHHRRTAEKGCRTPLRASRIGAAARRHGKADHQRRHPQDSPTTRFLAHGMSLLDLRNPNCDRKGAVFLTAPLRSWLGLRRVVALSASRTGRSSRSRADIAERPEREKTKLTIQALCTIYTPNGQNYKMPCCHFSAHAVRARTANAVPALVM